MRPSSITELSVAYAFTRRIVGDVALRLQFGKTTPQVESGLHRRRWEAGEMRRHIPDIPQRPLRPLGFATATTSATFLPHCERRILSPGAERVASADPRPAETQPPRDRPSQGMSPVSVAVGSA